ncbi:MAG: hypothetical protein GY700_01835 [Propionibacteriaceae bacterium]|nr:hypothetical protein [Propionibacteriaceae bacterium]
MTEVIDRTTNPVLIDQVQEQLRVLSEWCANVALGLSQEAVERPPSSVVREVEQGGFEVTRPKDLPRLRGITNPDLVVCYLGAACQLLLACAPFVAWMQLLWDRVPRRRSTRGIRAKTALEAC